MSAQLHRISQDESGADLDQALRSLSVAIGRVAACLPQETRPFMTHDWSVSSGEFAALMYRLRRERDLLFPDIFSEPSWDMLLDLKVAHAQGQHLAVSSACIASASPMSTAMRHLEALCGAGLVIRTPDPTDRRRALLLLSDTGRELIDLWVARAMALLRDTDGSAVAESRA